MKQSSHVLQPVVGEETTGSKPDDWKAILEKVVPSIGKNEIFLSIAR